MLLGFFGVVFLIGFLVLIHETGHFVAAKLFGVGVPIFSIGMGPRLFGFHRGGTDYRISILPIGGYVLMEGGDPFGDDEDEVTWVDPEHDLNNKPVWQRLIISFAGPAVNLALPFVLFTALLMMGRPDWNSRIGTVLPGTPAAEAGLQVDDVITAVDDEEVVVWDDVERRLLARAEREGPVQVTVDRDGATVTTSVPGAAITTLRSGRLDNSVLGIEGYYLAAKVGVEDLDSPAGRAGLLTGDRILTVDGTEVERWTELLGALGDGGTHALTWERRHEPETDGGEVTTSQHDGAIVLDDPYVGHGAPYDNAWGVAPVTLFAREVSEGDPAEAAGVRAGDRFLAVDGVPILTFYHFIDAISATATDDGTAREVALTVVRDGEVVSTAMVPELRVVEGEAELRPIIGVSSHPRMAIAVDQVRKYYGFVEAVPRAVDESLDVMGKTLSLVGLMATGQAPVLQNTGGPVAIAVIASSVIERGFFPYAMLIGVLSVSLGIINLLPVPGLDGGSILFYLVELVRGRPLSIEIREKVQMAGVVALVIFFLAVTTNDITTRLLPYLGELLGG